MQPITLLTCLGKALVGHADQAAGVSRLQNIIAEVGDEIWQDWHDEIDAQGRRDDLEGLLQIHVKDLRRQVEEVVANVAADRGEEFRRRLSNWLEEVPARLRYAVAGPELPAGFLLRGPQDLVSLLSGRRVPGLSGVHMPSGWQVTLTMTRGPLQSRKFNFPDQTTCLIGRGDDCHLRLPFQRISRYHCLLEFNLPELRVRDLGSLNGSWINTQEIGHRAKGGTPRPRSVPTDFDMEDGDELRLGKGEGIDLRIQLHAPTLCATCAAPLPEGTKARSERAPGVYQCETCRIQPTQPKPVGPPRECIRCGRVVAGQHGTQRPGTFLCRQCREDPQALAQDLLEQAQAGEPALTTLRGFALAEELGRGRHGAVYRIRLVKRDLALKLLLPPVAVGPQALRRFLGDIAGSQLLRHPNVVRIWEAGVFRGVIFLLLDYCNGRSVAHLMNRRGGKLGLEHAVEITLQALKGLDYAQTLFDPAKGLVHRDFQPANLLLAEIKGGWLTRVGDFGLARAFDDAGLSGGTFLGESACSPYFMPRPQLVNFRSIGAEGDVWAAAASLYNMLTGQYPRDFPADSDPWLQVLETNVVPIHKRESVLPKRLAAVIDQALDEKTFPFKTAAALREALEKAM
jgi:serine/threonine-protein kinase